ncbi:MAG: patatin-like phospholipase family protein, partial [Lentisphaerae bacterium]|nr:patatin-like phospholipase family protein [Lentisphaerota bacterium]
GALEDLFGKTTLADVYKHRKIRLCIPTTETSSFKPVVFKTPHLPGRNRDDTRTLVDVCMASAAAPIYLPLATQPNPLDSNSTDNFADGGLWANNPAMIGFTEALLLNQGNIDIVSAGTCETPNGDPFAEKTERGIKDWMFGAGIVKLSLAAQAKATCHVLDLIEQAFQSNDVGLKIRFLRFLETAKSPEQYSAIDLDRSDQLALKTMTNLAKKDAEEIHSQVLSHKLRHGELLQDIFQVMGTIHNK